MELKAIIAIALVVFIIGGLIFLQVRSRKKRKFWRNGRIEAEHCDHGFFWNLPGRAVL